MTELSPTAAATVRALDAHDRRDPPVLAYSCSGEYPSGLQLQAMLAYSCSGDFPWGLQL